MRSRLFQTPPLSCLVVIGWLLCVASGCAQPAVKSAEADAVAMVNRLQGKLVFDETQPDRPVVKVYLNNGPVSDTDLALLRSLKQMHNLFLGKTGVTDAGLLHLQDAVQLKTLSLNGTAVTDAGLVHLEGLKNLKTLNLQETHVSAAGAARLKAKLPGLTVAR